MSNISLWTNRFKHLRISCTSRITPAFACISFTRRESIGCKMPAFCGKKKTQKFCILTSYILEKNKMWLLLLYILALEKHFWKIKFLPLQPYDQYGFSRLEWTPWILFFPLICFLVIASLTLLDVLERFHLVFESSIGSNKIRVEFFFSHE